MREAFLSDVHGNLEALQAVEEALRALGVSRVHFVGDAVGYGPDPSACVGWVRANAVTSVVGNHDHAALGKTDTGSFNTLARLALEWSLPRLTPEDMATLEGWPLVAEADGVTLVHSNLRSPGEWGYITTLWDAEVNFGYFTGDLCLVGHSHQPVMVRRDRDGNLSVVPGGKVQLEEGCRYLVNVGSVGQPRDGNPESSFGLLDRVRGEFSLERVPYDVGKTQDKMRRAGLPEHLAARLALGR